MRKHRLKKLLKLGLLFFGISFLVINCKQDELITYEENNEINAKTVSFEQAIAFFQNKKGNDQFAKRTSSKELLLNPDWNSIEHSDLVYTEAQLTKANTEVNRNGDYTSKLLFINIDDQIKSIILTTWVTDYDSENNIVNATIYFNDYDGAFMDAYKIENGRFTKRLVPSTNTQTASFFMFLQDIFTPDCWNTDNLEGGELETVDLGTVGSGGSSFAGVNISGPANGPGTGSVYYSGYVDSGISGGSGYTGSNSISKNGIDLGATLILMNSPIDPDEKGNCPAGYTKNPKTGKCDPICNGGKIYNTSTEECNCPRGKSEDDNGNCVDNCNTSKEDLKLVFPNTSEATLEEIADAINEHGKDFGIDTKEKLQHFLSQAGHESTNYGGIEFGVFTENLNYRVNQLGTEGYWQKYFNPITNPTADPNKANPNDYIGNTNSSGITYVNHESFANYVYNDEYRDDSHKLGNINSGDGYKYRGRGIIQLTGRSNYNSFNTFYQTNYDSSVNLLNNPDLVASNKEIAVISALWFFKNKVIDNITNGINENTSVEKVTKRVNGKYKGLNHRKELHTNATEHIDCL
jgi:putative chitinase